MMQRLNAVLAALTLSLLVTGWAARADTPAAETEAARIEAAAYAWIEAFTAGDLDALMTLYHPEVLVALNGQPAMRGIDEVREYFAPRVGMGEPLFELDIERIEVTGDEAHLLSAYWFALDLPDAPAYFETGRSLLLYRRDAGGRWLIYLDIDQQTPDVQWPSPSGFGP
ncbi:MAG: DUF4440 domain-containing protein [Gammaproteobacteria bacterium]|nr:MAG: DUF4440 domain-containing protein [Gammaproteobacteria bacterium]